MQQQQGGACMGYILLIGGIILIFTAENAWIGIIIAIIGGLLLDGKDTSRSPKSKNPSGSGSDSSDSEYTSYAKSMVQRYNAAYDSNSTEELFNIAQDMIGYHYSCASAHELDDAILLEMAVVNRPYYYDSNYTKGYLIDIFREQNSKLLN